MAGAPMQTRYVWQIVRDVSARAGLTTAGGRRVTPHALRRTFATEMLNRGVRLETVSRLLGHAATTITEQAYAQLTDQRIRAEVEQALHTERGKGDSDARSTILRLTGKAASGRRLIVHGGGRATSTGACTAVQ